MTREQLHACVRRLVNMRDDDIERLRRPEKEWDEADEQLAAHLVLRIKSVRRFTDTVVVARLSREHCVLLSSGHDPRRPTSPMFGAHNRWHRQHRAYA